MPKAPAPATRCTSTNSPGFPQARSFSPRCSPVQCDKRTGHFLCELITPQMFEAAVVFERPRWPLLNTERRVMRYALKQIEAGGGRPSICDNGRRNDSGGSPAENRHALHVRRVSRQRLAALERQPSEEFPRRPRAAAGRTVRAGLTAAHHKKTFSLDVQVKRAQYAPDHLDV